MDQIFDFLTRHWVLSSLFILLLILVIIEEIRAQGAGGIGTTPQLLTILLNREEAVVLDIRDSNVFKKEGHIIGAVNIPLDSIDQSMKKLEKYKKKIIVVVCGTGQKSIVLANKLRKQGFEKVQVLTGGLNAWKQANMPIVKK